MFFARMSTDSRRPSENRDRRPADDVRAEILAVEEPPFVGRQDRNPLNTAFDYPLFGGGSKSPGGAR